MVHEPSPPLALTTHQSIHSSTRIPPRSALPVPPEGGGYDPFLFATIYSIVNELAPLLRTVHTSSTTLTLSTSTFLPGRRVALVLERRFLSARTKSPSSFAAPATATPSSFVTARRTDRSAAAKPPSSVGGALFGSATTTEHTRTATLSSMATTTTIMPTRIREGSVVMNVPTMTNDNDSGTGGGGRAGGTNKKQEDVFYNPVQVQNRDLSLLMLALHWERRCIRNATAHLSKRMRKDRPDLSKDEVQDEIAKQQKEWEGLLATAATDDEVLQPRSNSNAGTSASSSSVPSSSPPYRVLDALAASGLRSLRYWTELRGRIDHIRINDLESAAIQRAHQNVTDNQLTNALVVEDDDKVNNDNSFPRGIHIQQGDAMSVMYQSRSSRPWSNIDLDPYGSAAPFLDGAVQAIENHGLLSVTCTDMAALGGSHPDTCFGRYHALPLQRSGFLQEMAVRILLYRIATAAAAYGRSIRPVLSVGMDFYVRVFVEVVDSKADVQDLSLHVGHVYQSTRCPSFVVVPTASMGGKANRVYQAGRVPSSHDPESFEIPDAGLKVGGPLWLGPIHDPDVVLAAMDRLEQSQPVDGPTVLPDTSLLATRTRILGLLESCRDELNDVPLYYKLPDLCSTLHMSCIPRRSMEAALRNAGYRASGYHKEPQALKTNAPNRVIWDILRTWYHQEYAPKANNRKVPVDGSVAPLILSKQVTTPDIDFTPRKEGGSRSNASSGYARFPMNPQPNWGPKAKAASGVPGKSRKRKADSDPDGTTTDAAATAEVAIPPVDATGPTSSSN